MPPPARAVCTTRATPSAMSTAANSTTSLGGISGLRRTSWAYVRGRPLGCPLRGGDHHSTRSMTKHVVAPLSEDGARARAVRKPRRSKDDDLRVSPLRLGNDGRSGMAIADETLDDAH